MRNRICDHPEAERLMQELALQLETVKGKKSYGYLPKKQKALVDEIVDQMEQLPTVAECYEKWWELQSQVEDFYSEKERHRPPLSRQKEFRQIKNAVIQEAETIRLGEITFEDDALDMRQSDEVDKDENVSWDFWTLRIDVQDEYLSLAERDDAVESMRELAENGDVHAQYFMGKLLPSGCDIALCYKTERSISMKHDKKAITAMVTGMAIGAALVSEAAAGIIAEPTWQKIYVDGQQVSMTAYNIAGQNYVRLRDIGQQVGFNVYWQDGVQIDTDAPYTGVAPVQLKR